MGASSIYKRVSDLESYIPQLDAAQTENANELLQIIALLASSYNKLLALLAQSDHISRESFNDLVININEALENPK